MNNNQKAFISGVGMITSVGANAEMTTMSVNAGISAYSISQFFTQNNESITMASVPRDIFKSMVGEIIEGDVHSEQYDHIIKMAIIALQDALKDKTIKNTIPLILTMPEPSEAAEHLPPEILITNLIEQKKFPLEREKTRCIHMGRASGFEAMDLAIRYLYDAGEDYVLIGGSDSYQSYTRIDELGSERLKTATSMDGFVPGEGAGFLLLTRHPQNALVNDGNVISFQAPSMAEETGHLYSDEPYRGDGLDKAFKKVFSNYTGSVIDTIYSSMNGENHWAKEYGVAVTRNKALFHDEVENEHPADCFGDLGAATSPVLIGLAALNMLKKSDSVNQLVYSSSDYSWRGAVILEKMSQLLVKEGV